MSIDLNYFCDFLGIKLFIAHFRLLAIWHEHTRHTKYDRDNHVKINFENIEEEYKYNFQKREEKYSETFEKDFISKTVL